MNIKDLDTVEDDLIEKFRRHPILSNLDKISNKNFIELLLQRRFISYLSFMPLYDLAIDGLRGNNLALKVSRKIEREEYPGNENTLSHRELFFQDLISIGVPEDKIYSTHPTEATIKSNLDRVLMALKTEKSKELFQIKLLVTLRLSGELFTSEDYHLLAKRIERFNIDKRKTKFFWAHYVHDKKKIPLYVKAKGGSHSDAYIIALQKLLTTDERIKYAIRAAKNAYKVRADFYNQFEWMLPKELR